jgi:hypothetical protein
VNAYLIVEAKDPKTAEWFYANASWQALDAAGRAGFDEARGFEVVLTLPADAVWVAGDGYN